MEPRTQYAQTKDGVSIALWARDVSLMRLTVAIQGDHHDEP